MAFPDPEVLHALAYTAVALVLLTWTGNRVCKWVLDRSGLNQALEDRTAAAEAEAAEKKRPAPPAKFDAKVGRFIGVLERTLLVIGVLTASWEVLAAVIALKTVARFKELDERLDAEYFLVGSLFSILWAICMTAAWIGYDQTFGLNLSQGIADAVKAFKGD